MSQENEIILLMLLDKKKEHKVHGIMCERAGMCGEKEKDFKWSKNEC